MAVVDPRRVRFLEAHRVRRSAGVIAAAAGGTVEPLLVFDRMVHFLLSSRAWAYSGYR